MASCHYKLLPFIGEQIKSFFVQNCIKLIQILSTIISFPSFNIVYIAKFNQELLPFVHEMLSLFCDVYSPTKVIFNGI